MFSKFVIALSLVGAVAASVNKDAMVAQKMAVKKARSVSAADRNKRPSVKNTVQATSWVQYSLYGEGSDCEGDSHYMYWQSVGTCSPASYITNYNENYFNYVSVECAESNGVVTVTNKYYSDDSCTSLTNTQTTSVNATCSSQKNGAYNANTNTGIDDDSLYYDQYVTVVGNVMASACISDVANPWKNIENPNGLANVQYDTYDCSGYPLQADLFIYDICSKQTQSASTLGDYVKLSDCDDNNYEADFAYYDDAECSGTRLTNQEITILGKDYCWITSSSAENSVGEGGDNYNYCLGSSGAASMFTFNFALVGAVAFAAVALF